MTREQLAALWGDIVQAVIERDSYFQEEPDRPVMGPPATARELADLEHHLGLELPPSYAEFLLLYNGVQNFFYNVPLLSTHQIIAGPGDWVDDIAEFHEGLDRFVVAGDDESFAGALVFDTRTVSDDGEMEVVHLDMKAQETRWPSFVAYLESYLDTAKQTIAKERADRESLED